MNWRKESAKLLLILLILAGCFLLPIGAARFDSAILEGLHLVRWYAREHVLLCLIPAFLIAGAIATFVRSASVVRYLGAGANRAVSYGVASVSGAVLAVCSCTVLPLFAGIYRMGAGIGPASTFLYAGPAINVLAMVLTARVLGLRMGIARAVGAVVFSVLLGLLMHALFRNDPRETTQSGETPASGASGRPLWQTGILFAAMVGVLVFANWARSGDVRAVFLCCPGGLTTYRVEGRVLDQDESALRIVDTAGQEHVVPAAQLRELSVVGKKGVQDAVYGARWYLVCGLIVALCLMVRKWVSREETSEWLQNSWGFTKQILPLLLVGVLAAGFFLGRPAREGLIPSRWVELMVGGTPAPFLAAAGLEGTSAEALLRVVWPLWTCLFASIVGALMYFATLTEVPILQGLMGSGMGQGPALSLLLAGPALSLPNMLVIRSVIGAKRTAAFVLLVVVMATLTGLVYGLVPS